MDDTTKLHKVVAGLFNAAAGRYYLPELAAVINADFSIRDLAKVLVTKPIFSEVMLSTDSPAIKATILAKNFGLTADGVEGSAASQAIEYFTAGIEGGANIGDLVVDAVEFLSRDDLPEVFAATAALLENKAAVANAYTGSETDLASLQAVLAGVTSDYPSTPDEVAEYLDQLGDDTFTLTQRADNLIGNSKDNIFLAPVTQNETGSGALANTLDTGDILNGMGGRNILSADLIASGSVSDSWSPAISATTENIQEVYLRAQSVRQDDDASNTTFGATIDAQKMQGVEQWWSDNSRADIRIEDIRSRPVETTFGMRLTDPNVDYEAYFNPLFMEGVTDAESTLTLIVQEITDGQDPSVTELANIVVREVNFSLNDTDYTLDTPDIRAANTWAELEAAIAAELTEQGLSSLTITHTGNGVFEINDNAGGVFAVQQGEALILGVTSDIDTRNRVEVGRVETEGQTRTTLILDGVGNGSLGGGVNIAAMSGDRGVEVIDVVVDRNSHIRGLRSENNPRDDGDGAFSEEQQLEEVYVTHAVDGAGGTLQIGDRTVDPQGVSTTTDDRLETNGLRDVRIFDASGFNAALKVGASLTEAAFDKYLEDATEPVQFSYLLGDAGSNLNLFVDNDLASDPDFRLEIIGGEMDDRINLVDLETKNTTSIDGGNGQNTVEVTTSTTGEAGGGFAEGQRAWNSFENIQTLVVAGGNDTVQNLVTGNMEGLEKVIVASNDPDPADPSVFASTTLEQMRMDQDLIISGKNQTLGSGNSNNDQQIGNIVVDDTSAVPGVSQFDIELDNTARVDGVLAINSISVTGDDSAITTLGLLSNGRRDTSNVVNDFAGARVTTLNLLGTQTLSINVTDIATLPVTGGDTPPLTITGAELGGDLTLAMDGGLLTRESLDVLTGTAGDSDALQLYGVLDTASPTVSGFETVQFGAAFNDLANTQAEGTYDAVNTSGVNLYRIDNLSAALVVENLRGQETVRINANDDNDGNPFDANQDITLSARSRATSNEINISIVTDTAASQYTSLLEINDYRTINLNFTGENNASDTFAPSLVLNGFTVAPDDFANYARTLNVTGGQFSGAANNPVNVDTLDIGFVPPSLTNIDFSAFKGDVLGAFDEVRDEDGIPYVAQTDFWSNTTIRVNAFNFTWDNGIGVVPVRNETITTFRFTTDAYNDTVTWTIDGFNAFNDGTTTLSDVSILDLRDLGVEGLAEVVITDVGGTDTIITSNQGLDFEIFLAGVVSTDLSNENFAFAV
ncbi:MAG: hypothetical protein KF908_06320 [Nitrosomonas sp.]|nr:hypothetical protein [Nitrosomonas sp.]MCW5608141.1 hypothetical protein [Nitrosomonas sp.]